LTNPSRALLGSITERLRRVEPIERVEGETASVAAIFRNDPRGEEVLLIKRADRAGDPWSGDVAFPGGRVEAEDSSFRETAVREAREEVGVDLTADARFLGYMGAFRTRRKGIWVVPSLFLVTGKPMVRKNNEVSSHMWVPLHELLREENRSTYSPGGEGGDRSFPSFNLGGYTVWGLTERILSSMMGPTAGGTGQPTSRRTS